MSEETTQAACADIRKAVDHWRKVYASELDCCDLMIEDCRKKKDDYGVNFHQGFRAGLVWNDISLHKLKEFLDSSDCGKALLEEIARYRKALEFYAKMRLPDDGSGRPPDAAQYIARNALNSTV